MYVRNAFLLYGVSAEPPVHPERKPTHIVFAGFCCWTKKTSQKGVAKFKKSGHNAPPFNDARSWKAGSELGWKAGVVGLSGKREIKIFQNFFKKS